MKESAFMSRSEEEFISELDRYINLSTENTGHKPKRLVLSRRQVKILNSVFKRTIKHPDMYPELDPEKKTYRGILLEELAVRDPLRRKRKDLMEIDL